MTRPLKPRRILFDPGVRYFKPRAVPLSELEEVEINREELEVLRLCDAEDWEQERAAKQMGISQSTLQRALHAARRKIADAVVNGKAIKIRKER